MSVAPTAAAPAAGAAGRPRGDGARPRVLFVITGLDVGGAERQLLRLLPRLPVDATVASLRSVDAVGRRLERVGVRVVYLGLRPDLLNLAAAVWRFRRLLRGPRRPDAVYSLLIHANLFTRLFARLFGARRVICSVRNKHIDKPALNLLDRVTQRLVDLYVPNSPAIVPFLIEHQRIPRRKIRVVPNVIDRAEYAAPVDRAAKRRELGLAADAFVAVCVASLHPKKDHDTLLRALARTHDVELLLVGDGPLRQRLERRATELGVRVRVRFLGQRSDVVEILKASDVFLLASRHEGMSNALMEAMAARTPVIVSDTEENLVLVRPGVSGLAFPAGDAAALVRRLAAARDRARMARLADAAYDRLAEYGVERGVRGLRAVVEDMGG